MENAVDAIKIAFGLLVFVIAITLTFSVVGQAKATSDTIFKMNDKTSTYEYATESSYNANENRTVGFETILPTIHRYAKEQYAVTIFNKQGVPIVRYDLYTEGFMANWNEVLKRYNLNEASAINTYNEVKQRLDPVQYAVNPNINIMDYIGTNSTALSSNTNLLYYGKSDVRTVNIVSPWMGDPNNDTIARIKADMEGKDYEKNGITYIGKNLLQYKDAKFTEKFIQISTSGETITEGSDTLETIKGNKKLEIIYIMQ